MNTARENGRDWDPNKSTVAMKHIYGTTAVRFNMQHELKINNKNQTEAEIKKKLGFWFAGLWNICVCENCVVAGCFYSKGISTRVC